MDPITIIFWIVVFACLIWLLAYACDKFSMPEPVKWICGLVVILILLTSLYHRSLPPIHF